MSHFIEVLREFAPIAHWTMVPASGASDAELATPPIVCWTFAESTEDFASVLRLAVSTFQGTMEWELRCALELRADGKRWTLMPKRIREYAETHDGLGILPAAAELKAHDPSFGRRANAELRQLTAHLLLELPHRLRIGPAMAPTGVSID